MDGWTCMRLFTLLEARGALLSLTHLTTTFPDFTNTERFTSVECVAFVEAFRRVAPNLVDLCYSKGKNFIGLEDTFPTMVALKRLRLDESTTSLDGPLTVPALEHIEFAWSDIVSFAELVRPLTNKWDAGGELSETKLVMDIIYTGTRPLEFTVAYDQGVADEIYLDMEETGWSDALLGSIKVNVWSADRSKSCCIKKHLWRAEV